MDLKRILRHLAGARARIRRAFPPATLEAIEAAIGHAEATHGGEIHVALEGALHLRALLRGQTPRQRALELFAQLHVWDTADNNGVLIYVLLADHAVEIVADRHIHARAGDASWQQIAQRMQDGFSQGCPDAAVLAGIAGVSAVLAGHFPQPGNDGRHVPDKPTVL